MGDVVSITKERTFPEKLLGLYERFAYAQKGGKNENLKFRFLQESEVKRRLNVACRDLGLLLASTDFVVIESHWHRNAKERDVHTVTVRCTLVLQDANAVALVEREKVTARALGPQQVILTGIGCGADQGDKAPMKACVSAFKYAVMNGCMVQTGDDPDEQDPGDTGGFEELLGNLQGLAGTTLTAPALQSLKADCAGYREHPRFEELRAAYYALPGVTPANQPAGGK